MSCLRLPFAAQHQVGLGTVWFGSIIVCVIEISLITPPLGMNIFVLSSVVPGIPTAAIWRGVMPFIAADILRMAVLTAFPAISLFLPRWLGL